MFWFYCYFTPCHSHLPSFPTSRTTWPPPHPHSYPHIFLIPLLVPFPIALCQIVQMLYVLTFLHSVLCLNVSGCDCVFDLACIFFFKSLFFSTTRPLTFTSASSVVLLGQFFWESWHKLQCLIFEVLSLFCNSDNKDLFYFIHISKHNITLI